MAFFKKTKSKVRVKEGDQMVEKELWYPKSVIVGKTITTEQLAKRIAHESTVAPADVLAVLRALSDCMGDFMAMGRSVKLDGIGSFHFSATAAGNGADTEGECTANLIKGFKVRFLPETHYTKSGGQRRAVRPLTEVDIDWVDVGNLKQPEDDEGE